MDLTWKADQAVLIGLHPGVGGHGATGDQAAQGAVQAQEKPVHQGLRRQLCHHLHPEGLEGQRATDQAVQDQRLELGLARSHLVAAEPFCMLDPHWFQVLVGDDQQLATAGPDDVGTRGPSQRIVRDDVQHQLRRLDFQRLEEILTRAEPTGDVVVRRVDVRRAISSVVRHRCGTVDVPDFLVVGEQQQAVVLNLALVEDGL